MTCKPRVAFVGCGAIGGYAGALMTRAGEDVVMIDPWPQHVEQMRRRGLQIIGTTPQENVVVPVRAMHVCDVPYFVGCMFSIRSSSIVQIMRIAAQVS